MPSYTIKHDRWPFLFSSNSHRIHFQPSNRPTNQTKHQLGSTAIGVRTKEGVVLAAEKRVTSPLLIPSSIEKVAEIDEHVGCAMSGLTADARTLIDHGRTQVR